METATADRSTRISRHALAIKPSTPSSTSTKNKFGTDQRPFALHILPGSVHSKHRSNRSTSAFYLPIDLETVVSATPAGQDIALDTLIDKHGKNIITLLTLLRAITRLPALMIALVTLQQPSAGPFHPLGPVSLVHRSCLRLTIDDHVGPDQKMLFIPRGALASLPLQPAHITELRSASTCFKLG